MTDDNAGDFHRHSLTALASLISALDSDSDRAGEIYEQHRKRLWLFFIARGCSSAEDLVDRTFDRAASLMGPEPIRNFGAFFRTVAGFIYQEYLRSPERRASLSEDVPPLAAPESNPDTALLRLEEALEACLAQLVPNQRRMILEYYRGEKREKKAARVRLAETLHISMNALGIRAYKVRFLLEECINKRLEAETTA